MNIIENNNFTIEFIECIKIPIYIIYKIKVTCKVDMVIKSESILSNCGINLATLNIFDINDIDLFEFEFMKKNDTKELYIAFQKFNIATNTPKFFYEDSFTKVIL